MRLVYGTWNGGPSGARAFFWALAAAVVLFGALVRAGLLRVGPRLARALLAALALAATLAGIVVADRLTGRIRGKPPRGLIFPPGSEVRYETPEFEAVVRTNSLGFRGEECASDPGGRFRIVLLGDSFTMGWGVNIEDAWATLLQAKLRLGDPAVEVLNLGQGGAHPASYARNARVAVPALRPAVVVVAVLQGDDIFQTIDAMNAAGAPPVDLSKWEPSLADSAIGFVRTRLVPNLLGSGVRTDVTSNWKETARRLAENLAPAQRERFDRMDAEAKEVFLRGGLNPIVVQSAILYPDYYARHVDPGGAEAQAGIRRMSESLASISSTARENGARTVVVSIPYRAYVSKRDGAALRRIGFAIPDDLAESDGAAAAIWQAARDAGLDCLDVTLRFREACRSRELYYPLDGHFNRDGNAVFAGLLAGPLRAWLERTASAPSRSGR